MTSTSLAELERVIARDLSLIEYPSATWMPPPKSPGDLDVLIVGGGQGGLAIASQLLRERVDNILVIDENPTGSEGIWLSYARMKTLRTPKHIGGPDLGIPSLTFQAWFEAQRGAEAFKAIKYIAKEDWQSYLGWFRGILNLPLRSETRLLGLSPSPDGVIAARVLEAGVERTLRARKVVLAMGIETSGRWWTPPEIQALPDSLRAHTSEPIDFERLAGKDVIVIGAGASAFDNAAMALEHGARVRMLCRRPELQRIQPYKVLAYAGFLRNFGSLPDPDRWRIMSYLLEVREALTAETWARATRHQGFELITGAPVTAAEAVSQRARLQTPRGRFEADFVIAGTGFDMDLGARPELKGVAEHVARWSSRYTPPPEEANPRLGRYPYLSPGMSFLEAVPGSAPWVENIYCFNFGSTLSFGPSGSSISAMKFAAPRLVSALSESLFCADLAFHETVIRNYDVPEFELVYARDGVNDDGG